MQTYLIVRRGAWQTTHEAFDALARADAGAEHRLETVGLVHAYVLDESHEGVGAVCIYEAPSPEALRRHSAAARPPSRRNREGRRNGAGGTGLAPARRSVKGDHR